MATCKALLLFIIIEIIVITMTTMTAVACNQFN